MARGRQGGWGAGFLGVLVRFGTGSRHGTSFPGPNSFWGRLHGIKNDWDRLPSSLPRGVGHRAAPGRGLRGRAEASFSSRFGGCAAGRLRGAYPGGASSRPAGILTRSRCPPPTPSACPVFSFKFSYRRFWLLVGTLKYTHVTL